MTVKKNTIQGDNTPFTSDTVAENASFISTALRTGTVIDYDYILRTGQASIDGSVVEFDNISSSGLEVDDKVVIGKSTNDQRYVCFGIVRDGATGNQDILQAYDTTDQIGGTAKAMSYNTIDIENGCISIDNDSSGAPTKITFSKKGYYNVQFSAQLTQTGGTAHDVDIWLKHNDENHPNTTTRLQLANNNQYLVAAWNWFVEVDTLPQWFEIWWYTNSSNVSLEHVPEQAGPPAIPAIPSIILTVSRVG